MLGIDTVDNPVLGNVYCFNCSREFNFAMCLLLLL